MSREQVSELLGEALAHLRAINAVVRRLLTSTNRRPAMNSVMRDLTQTVVLIGEVKVGAERLQAENAQLRARVAAIERATPACFPGGTGVLSPEQWIEWAKKQLGYAADGVSACDGESKQEKPY